MGRQIEKLTEQLKEAHEALENAKKFGFDSAKEEAQRQMEEKLAEEREKRIKHTKEMAVRRIAKRELSKGWTAWLEGYLEDKRRRNMLLSAGNRLTRPKLAAAVTKWRRDWDPRR